MYGVGGDYFLKSKEEGGKKERDVVLLTGY
jgi:hypothetical protein